MKIKSLVLNLFVALLILAYAILTRQQSSPLHTENATEKSEDESHMSGDTTRDTSICTIANSSEKN